MLADVPSETMHRIDGLLRAGDFRAAQAELEALVAARPEYVEAQRLLAGVRLAQGDGVGAERILRRALARDPDWAPTLTMLGELLLNSGRPAEAESLLRRAIGAAAADPRAALVLARHCNDHRRPAEALAIATPFCVAGKAGPELTAQHVIALVALGRTDEAIVFYRRVVDSSPDNFAAAHALTLALQASSRHAEAERVARGALQRGFRDAALQHIHARSLIGLRDYAGAEAALRDCLKLDPQHVEAHNDLARLVWMRSGDGAQATAALDQALQVFANNDALRAAKAAVLQGAGDPRAAHACLAPRVAHADAPPALLVRAGLAALEFDPVVALDLAGRALRLTPAEAPARALLAAAQLGVGEARGALASCESLLDGAPDDQYLIALQTTAWRLLDDERYAQYCDYRKLVVPYRLEPPPPWHSLADFLADLGHSLARLHDALRHPLLFQSLRHGTETTEDLSRSEDPVIRALFAAFDAPIGDYIAGMGEGPDPLRRRRRATYRFNGSWSVRLRTLGFHHNHVHPRGWISSAFYVELPESMRDTSGNEGVLTFAQPGILTMPALPAEHEVRPEAGTLVLFPSYFWHGTVPFAGNDPRLTVAFDAVPGR
ncbi:MAG TPA: tetratricopeptide repeat protein [Rhodanobacteraceae bacterium]|nr:tetratricopeptide repeat protein [Rhodanobacteraceae bacterium]